MPDPQYQKIRKAGNISEACIHLVVNGNSRIGPNFDSQWTFLMGVYAFLSGTGEQNDVDTENIIITVESCVVGMRPLRQEGRSASVIQQKDM